MANPNLRRINTIFPRQWPSSRPGDDQKQSLDQSTDITLDASVALENGRLRNPYAVPTVATLSQSIQVLEKDVWEEYEGLEFSNTQGTCLYGRSAISRKRTDSWEKSHSLFVIKQHRITRPERLAHLKRPRCQQLVTLHCAFKSGDFLWAVYEEMDFSLESLFQLDRSPWCIVEGKRNLQIATICDQVLRGIEYLHRTLAVAHGNLCAENILLRRTGHIKIANLGVSVLEGELGNSNMEQDCLQFAEVVRRLMTASSNNKTLTPDHVGKDGYDFWKLLSERQLGKALQHVFIRKTQISSVARLAVFVARAIYDPPELIVVD